MVLLARRTRHRLLLALASVACVLMCCGVFNWQSELHERQNQSKATAALTTYLKRVQATDYHAAYQQLCLDVLPEYTESDHAAFLREQRQFASFSLGEPTISTGIDGTYLTFPVTLAYPDETTGVVRLAVGLETDGPKVCDRYDWRR